MKTTFKLAFVACLMMLSSACHAQKPIPAIDQAFDVFAQDLLKGDFVTSSSMNTYNIGMMKGFEFAIPERKQKMQMRGVRWEITEALSAKDLRKERIPDFVFQVADFLLAHGRFRGTVSQLLAAVGNTELKPNLASKHLTRHYSDVLLPLGITYEYRKTAAARLVLLELHDGADGHDGSSGSERLASLRKQNDGTFRLPQASSQASSASWEEAEDDEELPL
jgi:hypothetical protein